MMGAGKIHLNASQSALMLITAILLQISGTVHLARLCSNKYHRLPNREIWGKALCKK